jgi:hypothetical protein
MKNIKKTIFGILVVIISANSFFGCSNDNQNESEIQNISQQARLRPIDLDVATRMYRDMTLTIEYLEYKFSQQELLIKMNSNNVTFTDKKEWITWLETNLDKTTFSSIEEFSSMFDNSLNKLNIMIAANSVLYGFMADADTNDFSVILMPEHSTPPTQTTFSTCVDGCIDSNIAASNENWDNFIEDTEDGMQSGGILGSLAIYFAQINYEKREVQILADYQNCFSACNS